MMTVEVELDGQRFITPSGGRACILLAPRPLPGFSYAAAEVLRVSPPEALLLP
jgi:hypothetical protein